MSRSTISDGVSITYCEELGARYWRLAFGSASPLDDSATPPEPEAGADQPFVGFLIESAPISRALHNTSYNGNYMTSSPSPDPQASVPQADLQGLAFGPLHNGIAMPSFIVRNSAHAHSDPQPTLLDSTGAVPPCPPVSAKASRAERQHAPPARPPLHRSLSKVHSPWRPHNILPFARPSRVPVTRALATLRKPAWRSFIPRYFARHPKTQVPDPLGPPSALQTLLSNDPPPLPLQQLDPVRNNQPSRLIRSLCAAVLEAQDFPTGRIGSKNRFPERLPAHPALDVAAHLADDTR